MLNALLPNALPMAKSIAPIRKAASIETSSGSDVLSATSVVPTKVLPKPDCSASSPAASAMYGPARKIAAAHTPNPMIALASVMPGASAIGGSPCSTAVLSEIR